MTKIKAPVEEKPSQQKPYGQPLEKREKPRELPSENPLREKKEFRD